MKVVNIVFINFSKRIILEYHGIEHRTKNMQQRECIISVGVWLVLLRIGENGD